MRHITLALMTTGLLTTAALGHARAWPPDATTTAQARQIELEILPGKLGPGELEELLRGSLVGENSMKPQVWQSLSLERHVIERHGVVRHVLLDSSPNVVSPFGGARAAAHRRQL